MEKEWKEMDEEQRKYYEKGTIDALMSVFVLFPASKHVVWERYKFSEPELRRYIKLQIKTYEDKLSRARGIYKAQQALIKAASQLSIDGIPTDE